MDMLFIVFIHVCLHIVSLFISLLAFVKWLGHM